METRCNHTLTFYSSVCSSRAALKFSVFEKFVLFSPQLGWPVILTVQPFSNYYSWTFYYTQLFHSCSSQSSGLRRFDKEI